MSARSNGSVRRLKSFGTRSAMNGSAQSSQRSRAPLLHEHHLPVVVAQRDEIAVVVEVDEALARALLLLAGEVGQQVVAVDVHLERLAGRLVALLAASRRCPARRPRRGTSAASRGAGRSRWRRRPPGSCPGQRTISGTRNAPSQLVFFSLRNGVIAPSGQRVHVRPVVGGVHDDRVVGDARARRAGRAAHRRSCRGRSSCRGTATASGRPARGSPAWCACAGACGWC